MFRLRSRLVVAQPGESRLLLKSAPGRRIMFGAIGLLLVIAFLTGVNWEGDFQRDSIVGTMVYFALTLICVGVAAWGRALRIDSDRGEVSFVNSLFGLEVRRSSIKAADIQSVTIQGARFLKDSERPQPGLLNTRFRSYVDRRNTYYKLFLDTDGRRIFVEDTTEPSDLDAAGQAIAGFLQVPFRREEI